MNRTIYFARQHWTIEGALRRSPLAFSIVLALLMSTGCTVRLPQVEGLRNLVQAEFAKRGLGAESTADNRWQARYGGEGRLMTAYAEGNLTVFVSEEGDAIAFDGWVVRSLGGFGQRSLLGVVDTEVHRVFRSDSKVVSRQMSCQPWIKEFIRDQTIEWRQPCGYSVANTIRLDEQGLIVGIEQVVDAAGGRLTLRKL